MYESHYACHFFRLWGGKDIGQNNRATLLGNMQNPFDGFFGDVNGNVSARYFIVEFKLERRGIWDEVRSEKEKPHRWALFKKLISNKESRKLSHVGHFAAYPDGESLRFESYVDAAVPEKEYEKSNPHLPEYIMYVRKTNPLPQGFRVFGRTISFDVFHSFLTESDNSLSSEFPGYFKYGLGWDKEQLAKYVKEEMYGHLVLGKVEDKEKRDKANRETVLMLGMYMSDGTFRAVTGNVEETIVKLHLAFQKMPKANTLAP